MALDSQSLRLLLYARKLGAQFDHTLTVDRLDILMSAADIELIDFTRSPQQGDYAAEWAQKPDKGLSASRLAFYDAAVAAAAAKPRRGRAWLRSLTPEALLELRRTMLAARHVRRPPDPAHFKPFDPRA